MTNAYEMHVHVTLMNVNRCAPPLHTTPPNVTIKALTLHGERITFVVS